MDKKQKILAFTASSVVVLGLIYLYMFAPDVQMLKSQGSKKAIEASLIVIKGMEKGRTSFKLSAVKASSDRDQSVIEIEDIGSGTIFGEHGILLKNLKAGSATVYHYSNIIEARGTDKTPMTALIDINGASGKKKGRKEFSLLKAESLKYHTNTKTGTINNGALSNKRFRISGNGVAINTSLETALFYPSPAAETPSQRIIATTLESFYGQELLKGYGKAELKLNKGRTTVKADFLEFSTDDYSGRMEKGVKFSQKDKFSTSDRMDYTDRTKTAVLKGNVKTLIEKGSAVLKESTIEKIRNAETKKMLKDGMLLTCEKLSVSTNSGNASAEGRVELLQKKNRARSDKAFFDEAKQSVTMTGNVYVEKEGQWLKTQKVIASLGKEEFEAIGGVETLIKVKKKR